MSITKAVKKITSTLDKTYDKANKLDNVSRDEKIKIETNYEKHLEELRKDNMSVDRWVKLTNNYLINQFNEVLSNLDNNKYENKNYDELLKTYNKSKRKNKDEEKISQYDFYINEIKTLNDIDNDPQALYNYIN